MRELFLLITLHFVPFPLPGNPPLGKKSLKNIYIKTLVQGSYTRVREREAPKRKHQNT